MKHKKFTLTFIAMLAFTAIFAQSGLVAHWSFDSITDNHFLEHVSNQLAGTVYGTQSVPGPVGKALEFDGIDDYARIPGDNSPPPSVLSGLSEGSISLWFRVEDIPLEFGIRPIFYYGRNEACNFFDAANEGVIIEVGHSPIHKSSKRLYFTMWTNGCTFPSFCYDSRNPVTEGQWYHYVAVVGSDYNTGYLNGELMEDRLYNFGNEGTNEFFTDFPAHENLWIGRGYWDSNDVYFKGAIDEIKIFDHPLNQQEVDSLYAEGNLVSTGLEHDDKQDETHLYPNPAREMIYLDFPDYPGIQLIFKIYSCTGELVHQAIISGSNNTKTIDLSSLPKGLYVYVLENDDTIVKTDKLIIQ